MVCLRPWRQKDDGDAGRGQSRYLQSVLISPILLHEILILTRSFLNSDCASAPSYIAEKLNDITGITRGCQRHNKTFSVAWRSFGKTYGHLPTLIVAYSSLAV